MHFDILAYSREQWVFEALVDCVGSVDEKYLYAYKIIDWSINAI
jgi:hypothetical protein